MKGLAGIPEQIELLEQKSERFESPCGDGSLVVRRWPGPNEAAETVLLVHGGSGSWTHWFRNIEYLTKRFHVYAIDLPGLGHSGGLPPGEDDAADAVSVVSRGIKSLPGLEKFHIVAFSWGCAISSQLVKIHREELLSLMLVGPGSLGDIPRRVYMTPLVRWQSGMSRDEVLATHKENLARLMFHQRARIDDMAVYLQDWNTDRARFNSRQYELHTLSIDGVEGMNAPLKVIYGENDAPGVPNLERYRELFQAVKPDVHFEIVPDAGHWLPYERSELFNKICERWLSENGSL